MKGPFCHSGWMQSRDRVIDAKQNVVAHARETFGLRERRRFGYRHLGDLLAREGLMPNYSKLLRMYRAEGLKVLRRCDRKRAQGNMTTISMAQGPNQRWSLDFVSDAFACGRRFCILCLIDNFSRK